MFGFFSPKPEANEVGTPLDTGVYILKNRTSGTVLELQESAAKPVWMLKNRVQGSPQIEPTDLKQCWLVTTLRHENYVAFLNMKGGTYVDLDDGSSSNGTLCYGYPLPAKFPLAGTEGNKEWLPTRNAEGFWRFKNRQSGTFLEIDDGSSKPGATVQGWRGNPEQTNQQWELIPAPPSLIPGVSAFVPLRNWMSAIPDDAPIASLSVPGTHQSGSILRDSNLQCQENNHRWAVQLYNGIRHFDLGTFYDAYKERIVGVSNSTEQDYNYLGFQTSVERYLAEFPTEIVFAFVSVNSKTGADMNKVYNKEYIDKWWQSMSSNVQRSPNLYARCHGHGVLSYPDQTVKELRGKLVLVVRNYNIVNVPRPEVDWAWRQKEGKVTELHAAAAYMMDGTVQSKWGRAKTIIDAAAADPEKESFYMTSLDTDSFHDIRRRGAFELNLNLEEWLKGRDMTKPCRIGFIALDFYHVPFDLVGEIVATNALKEFPF